MNNFYLAKKGIQYSGYLNLIWSVSWAFLIFIICIYHFAILIDPNNPSLSYQSFTSNDSSRSITNVYAGELINSKGYSHFFKAELLNLYIFKITLWHIVLLLFLVIVFSLVAQFVIGLTSLFFFIKAKNMMLIYAAVAVVFLPLFGGIIALNTYRANTNPLSPKYIASYSMLRYKIKQAWNNVANNDLEK